MAENTPRVSLIVPVYNTEKYLQKCLDSLVSQTLRDIEIILVNDCSPDNSEVLILEYAAKDPRIVYIKHSVNKKQGGARNTGIRTAQGEWLCFADSDDTIAPHILQKTLDACTRSGANLGIFGIMEYDESRPSLRSYWDLPPKSLEKNGLGFHTIGLLTFSPCARLYKREDLIHHQILFPENIFFEDWVFYYTYTALVKPKVAVVREHGYFYRRHEKSTTGQIAGNGVYFPIAAQAIAEFLKKEGLWQDYKTAFFLDFPIRMGAKILQIQGAAMGDFLKKFRTFCRAVDPSAEDMALFPAPLFLLP